MRFRTLCISVFVVAVVYAQPTASSFVSNAPNAPAPAKVDLSPEMRGDIFMARKMYREAVEMYQQMPQSSPVTWNKVGIAFHQLGQLKLARKNYERSIKLNTSYAEAINNLGTVDYAEKNYRRAVNHYRKALKFAPDSASMRSNLGTALFARKKYDLAFAEYQKALALDPNVFESRGSQGTVLQERSVVERAKFHYHLAKLYAQGGQPERAIQYLRKALEEGYNERDKIATDDAFQGLRDHPEFQTLLKTEFRAL